MQPEEIMRELDRYIVGQNDAKKAVAVAMSILSSSFFAFE